MESIQISTKYQSTDGAEKITVETIATILREKEKHFCKRVIEHRGAQMERRNVQGNLHPEEQKNTHMIMVRHVAGKRDII